ncbi:MAG: sialate O-acetylesterase [Muribaculaceae bacterium]|nr:sialate O-acetylesterase [Muribaculaceae bacterium]
MTRNIMLAAIAALLSVSASTLKAESPLKGNEVPIFITIGQSNADGSAMFDPAEDARMEQWYTSEANPGTMKMWYRSSKVANQPRNARGEYPRWVVDGDTTDMAPGWLDLWYRNENTAGRTAMNMIHGYGTYSTGTGTDCAQGRRGMEGEFGIRFQEHYPGSELYMLKLGASGSQISTWTDSLDSHNWHYFLDHVYRPAIMTLLSQGKQPVLAGVWWMQGCGDAGNSEEYYRANLERLVSQCRNDLGFPDARIYVGHVVKPGESAKYPDASVQFGQGVRDAQDAVAAADPRVDIVDTRSVDFQYEKAFNGHLHYSHQGVNLIGRMLADSIAAAGPDTWSRFNQAAFISSFK